MPIKGYEIASTNMSVLGLEMFKQLSPIIDAIAYDHCYNTPRKGDPSRIRDWCGDRELSICK